MQTLIEKIKEKVNCIDIASLCNRTITNGRSGSVNNPESQNPSLVINEDDFYDHSEDKGGDCINLYAVLKGISNSDAIQELASYLSITSENYQKDDKRTVYNKILNTYVKTFQKELKDKEEAKNFLINRGITGKSALDFKIGYAESSLVKLAASFDYEDIAFSGMSKMYQRITFPFFNKNKKVVYLTGRTIADQNPKYRKIRKTEYTQECLYGLNTINKDTKEIVIAEGILDVISLYQTGNAAISSASTSFSNKQKELLLKIVKGLKITICFDYDNNEKQAGQTGMIKIGQFLFDNGIDANLCFLSKVSNDSIDVNQYYMENGHTNFIKDTILFSSYTIQDNPDSLETIARGICKHFSQLEQYKYQIALGKTLENPSLVKEAFKIAKKAPSELVIVNDLMEKEQILYSEKSGWYQYLEEGLWNRIDRTCAEYMIGKEYGNFKTNSRINATTGLLRVESYYAGLLNEEKTLFNMKNGMVDLNAGKLIPHDSKYMSTTQSKFEFNICNNYKFAENFFNQLACGNEQDINYFKDALGELLVEDNRFEKMHFHVGNGGNGKSELLNIMKMIIGQSNYTAIGVHDFDKDFQIIRLKDSMLNVASESQAHDKKCEEVLKAAVSGEELTGSWKGKDFIDFKTRAKFHFAMNKLPGISDKSNGSERRILICKYNAKFVDKPTGAPNEIQRILGYKNILRDHINEFINIAVSHRLKVIKQNYITEPSASKQLFKKVKQANNPILTFIEKEMKGIFFTGETHSLYNRYKGWCIDENHRPLTKTNFEMEINDNNKIIPFKKVLEA